METGNARGVIMESSTQVYHWMVSDFSSRRENCLDQAGHPAGSPGMDCSSPQKSISIAPWANQLPIYVSFHKFGAASKYDSILRQFGRRPSRVGANLKPKATSVIDRWFKEEQACRGKNKRYSERKK